MPPLASAHYVVLMLRVVGCCACLVQPVTVGEGIERLFGLRVSQTYAMTESMPIAANPIGETRKLTTVGFAAGPEIRICDDTSAVMRAGDEGEVCVRGGSVTVGYEVRKHMAKDPNMEAFHPDAKGNEPPAAGLWVGYDKARAWLRTGDKGYVDGDGHLQLVGRFKEIINRGALRHPSSSHPTRPSEKAA
jgi:acyl-CoA synthetase (AMP-forming)/AMP-acid ligase II